MKPTMDDVAFKTDPKGNFGLYNGVEKCWLGTKKGPLRYSDWTVTKVAATIATEAFGYFIRPGNLPENLRPNGALVAKFSGLEAIQRIEARVK